MKAGELMIGDWVYSTFLDGPTQIKAIDKPYFIHPYASVKVVGVEGVKDIHSLTPIPLTPEILEKNGFIEYNYDEGGDIPKLIFGRFADNSVFIEIHGDCEFGHLEEYYPRYVHQLQHALRLCGINKEIVL